MPPAMTVGPHSGGACFSSAARAAGSVGGSVPARPPTSQQRLRHNRCAHLPCSGRLAGPTIPRPASLLEIDAEDACTGNERASRRREAWRKRKPHRLCAARQDQPSRWPADVTETACTTQLRVSNTCASIMAAISSASLRAGRERMQSLGELITSTRLESVVCLVRVRRHLLRLHFLLALNSVLNHLLQAFHDELVLSIVELAAMPMRLGQGQCRDEHRVVDFDERLCSRKSSSNSSASS